MGVRKQMFPYREEISSIFSSSTGYGVGPEAPQCQCSLSLYLTWTVISPPVVQLLSWWEITSAKWELSSNTFSLLPLITWPSTSCNGLWTSSCFRYKKDTHTHPLSRSCVCMCVCMQACVPSWYNPWKGNIIFHTNVKVYRTTKCLGSLNTTNPMMLYSWVKWRRSWCYKWLEQIICHKFPFLQKLS